MLIYSLLQCKDTTDNLNLGTAVHWDTWQWDTQSPLHTATAPISPLNYFLCPVEISI